MPGNNLSPIRPRENFNENCQFLRLSKIQNKDKKTVIKFFYKMKTFNIKVNLTINCAKTTSDNSI